MTEVACSTHIFTVYPFPRFRSGIPGGLADLTMPRTESQAVLGENPPFWDGPHAPIRIEAIEARLRTSLPDFRRSLASRGVGYEQAVAELGELSRYAGAGGNAELLAWDHLAPMRQSLAELFLYIPRPLLTKNIGAWAPFFALVHDSPEAPLFRSDARCTWVDEVAAAVEPVMVSADRWDLRRAKDTPLEPQVRSKIAELYAHARERQGVSLGDHSALLKRYSKNCVERKGGRVVELGDLEGLSLQWVERSAPAERRRDRRERAGDEGCIALAGQEWIHSEIGLDGPVGLLLKWRGLPLAAVSFYPEGLLDVSCVQVQHARFWVQTAGKQTREARHREIPIVPGIRWERLLIEAAEQALIPFGFRRVIVPEATPENLARFTGRDVDPHRVASYYGSTAQALSFTPSQEGWVRDRVSFDECPLRTIDLPVIRRR